MQLVALDVGSWCLFRTIETFFFTIQGSSSVMDLSKLQKGKY